jgi:hypothetical protein
MSHQFIAKIKIVSIVMRISLMCVKSRRALVAGWLGVGSGGRCARCHVFYIFL